MKEEKESNGLMFLTIFLLTMLVIGALTSMCSLPGKLDHISEQLNDIKIELIKEGHYNGVPSLPQ